MVCLTRGCCQPLLPPSPGDPSDAAFGRQVPQAFSLHRDAPDTPLAQKGAPGPAPPQNLGFADLAGGIFEKTSKNGPPTTHLSEVVQMKRNP